LGNTVSPPGGTVTAAAAAVTAAAAVAAAVAAGREEWGRQHRLVSFHFSGGNQRTRDSQVAG
jgi:hypothetical protein